MLNSIMSREYRLDRKNTRCKESICSVASSISVNLRHRPALKPQWISQKRTSFILSCLEERFPLLFVPVFTVVHVNTEDTYWALPSLSLSLCTGNGNLLRFASENHSEGGVDAAAGQVTQDGQTEARQGAAGKKGLAWPPHLQWCLKFSREQLFVFVSVLIWHMKSLFLHKMSFSTPSICQRKYDFAE